MIEFHQGLFKDKEKLASLIKPYGPRFAVLISEELVPLFGDAIPNAYLFTFPGGEKNKTRAMKEKIEDQMMAKGLGRDTCLIAIGGGVTTDLGGFIAATYCRGIPLILIPTSLLGMVDASIGGKTAVNTPYGKNLIGAFYSPKKIFIDIDVLETLPQREFRNGIAEMIKHGAIADPAYFKALELHSLITEDLIRRSCEIKQAIVREDERESGKRRFLNFGHTIGHALEQLSSYTLPHGEAVAIGMTVESQLAVHLGILSPKDAENICELLTHYQLPTKLPPFSINSILETMTFDKKSIEGKPRFVILKRIGEAFDCIEIENSLLISSLN